MTLSDSLEVEDAFTEREEMDLLFQEHAVETEDDNSDSGVARIIDFKVTRFDSYVTKHDTVRFSVYFELPNGNKQIYSTDYTYGGDNPFIDAQLEQEEPVENITTLLGNEVYVEKSPDAELMPRYDGEKESWIIPDYDIILSEAHELPEWNKETRLSMAERFAEQYRNSQPPEEIINKATITDYYVTESRSGIVQELEIGLKFEIGMETFAYECLHDMDHPDEGLEQILNYLGCTEQISNAEGCEIPVVYDSVHNEWQMHLPKADGHTIHNLWFKLQRNGFVSPSMNTRIRFGRTFGQTDQTQQNESWSSDTKIDVIRPERLINSQSNTSKNRFPTW